VLSRLNGTIFVYDDKLVQKFKIEWAKENSCNFISPAGPSFVFVSCDNAVLKLSTVSNFFISVLINAFRAVKLLEEQTFRDLFIRWPFILMEMNCGQPKKDEKRSMFLAK
jgi:hypothetical protein